MQAGLHRWHIPGWSVLATLHGAKRELVGYLEWSPDRGRMRVGGISWPPTESLV